MAFDIVPPELVVRAMQDSGYKNAAYAIAELIDNSVQAGAHKVELLCLESEELVRTRQHTRLRQLAVLDDGHGMNGADLRRALQFGNGAHLADRKGIGRFGMGLPNSSMSQGGRVDVWTWINGVGQAIHSYLDLSEIVSGEQKEVPEPSTKAVPEIWKRAGNYFGNSGTLVVWSRPDRCTWRTASAVVRNSEEIVGRIYRRFLDDGRVEIRLAAFNEAAIDAPRIDRMARPNDPLYLMANTSCPDPFATTPMFSPWGDNPRREISVNYRGETHKIVVTTSYAKASAREGHNPGALPHGQHAARNLGVSVVRADRELELDAKWMPSYDPVARWLGIEVDFPPALDEVFGVTNNKQSAAYLADLAGIDKNELAERHGYRTFQELKRAWIDEEDVRAGLLEVLSAIDSAKSALMKQLDTQSKGKKGKQRYDSNTPEKVATEATEKRKAVGKHGRSDDDEGLDAEERMAAVKKGLIDDGVDEQQAGELAAGVVGASLKYVFGHADSTSSAFFSVKPKGGMIVITLNTQHPAYASLVHLLEESADEVGADALRGRLEKARDGLKLVLAAWARYEDEQSDGIRRTAAQEAREDWGRVARQFLEGTQL